MANSDGYTQVDTQKVEAGAEREKTGGEGRGKRSKRRLMIEPIPDYFTTRSSLILLCVATVAEREDERGEGRGRGVIEAERYAEVMEEGRR